ncbi:MAG: hypothetical protein FWG93_01825 [Oscillospiraceae bacterium]|nr:hypothetical protein [Oscillospiraceae bacterium]
MKKWWIGLLGLGLLLLLAFFLLGETLYERGKPVVTTVRASSFLGQEGVIVPPEALRSGGAGHYVYVLQSEQGYSRVIYTVSYVEVRLLAADNGFGMAVLEEGGGVRAGDRLVSAPADGLTDGIRVLWRNE